MEVFTQYRAQPFRSPARQLNCFVFHFFVSMLMGVLSVRFLKGSILLAAFTQANSAFMWHRLLCRIHCAALCSPFLGRLMATGSAKLGYPELLLECSRADKVIEILSSDSFGVCPEVVWDYSYSLHNDLLQKVYMLKGSLHSLIFLSLFFFGVF